MVKYLNRKSILDYDLEGDFNVESDCEGDLSSAKKETLEAEDEEEEETRAVLITGSFAAYVCFNNVLSSSNFELFSWKSLFFYRCTDAVSFTPPPQITRCRPSLGLHPRKDGDNGTPSLLAEEHLSSG